MSTPSCESHCHQTRPIELLQEEVHVWRASPARDEPVIEQMAQMLSADELIRANRFYFEDDRKRFVVGRALLRTILGYYLDIEPTCVPICYGRYRKPQLSSQSGDERVQFNVAHSQNIMLYAVTRGRRIGVDIERIHYVPQMQEIAKSFFSDSERSWLQTLAAGKEAKGFFGCWTRKEAYLKARGSGLAGSVKQLNASIDRGEANESMYIEKERHKATFWSFCHLTPAAGYVATVAIEGHFRQSATTNLLLSQAALIAVYSRLPRPAAQGRQRLKKRQ